MTALPELPSAYHLCPYDSIDSTNEEAKRQAESGAEDGTLIWAKEQTAGRGRYGRQWQSPPGNLYCSLITRPDCAPSEAAELGFVTSLGMADAIGSLVPPMIEVTFKWPNDILVNGRKAAGILLESSSKPDGTLDWLVVGTGLNIVSHPEESRYPATNLLLEGAHGLAVEDVLQAYARHLLGWINRWLDDGFRPIRAAWLNRAMGQGEEIEVRFNDKTVSGTFADLDETGALLLDAPEGRLTINAADIYPIR